MKVSRFAEIVTLTRRASPLAVAVPSARGREHTKPGYNLNCP